MSNLYKNSVSLNSVVGGSNSNIPPCSPTPVPSTPPSTPPCGSNPISISKNLCNCPTNNNINVCYTCILKHCMCFVPAVNLENAQVSYTVNPKNIVIELVSCGTMAICGLLEETVCVPTSASQSGSSPTYQTYTQNIPFQCVIRNENITDLNASHWSVTGVQIIDSCYAPTCPTGVSGSSNYYKLKEKNAILLQLTNSSAGSPSSGSPSAGSPSSGSPSSGSPSSGSPSGNIPPAGCIIK